MSGTSRGSASASGEKRSCFSVVLWNSRGDSGQERRSLSTTSRTAKSLLAFESDFGDAWAKAPAGQGQLPARKSSNRRVILPSPWDVAASSEAGLPSSVGWSEPSSLSNTITPKGSARQVVYILFVNQPSLQKLERLLQIR